MEPQKNIWNALVGLAGSIPGLLIVAIGMLHVAGLNDLSEQLNSYLDTHSPIFHPALIFGGLLFSVVLNIVPVFSVAVRPQDGTIVTTITTKLKYHNIGTLAVSAGLFCAILMYAFAENFRIIPR